MHSHYCSRGREIGAHGLWYRVLRSMSFFTAPPVECSVRSFSRDRPSIPGAICAARSPIGWSCAAVSPWVRICRARSSTRPTPCSRHVGAFAKTRADAPGAATPRKASFLREKMGHAFTAPLIPTRGGRQNGGYCLGRALKTTGFSCADCRRSLQEQRPRWAAAAGSIGEADVPTWGLFMRSTVLATLTWTRRTRKPRILGHRRRGIRHGQRASAMMWLRGSAFPHSAVVRSPARARRTCSRCSRPAGLVPT